MSSACTSAVDTRSLKPTRRRSVRSALHAGSSRLKTTVPCGTQVIEQLRLRGEVLLHRAVIVEMVAREIRERRDVEQHAFDAAAGRASATTPPSRRAARPDRAASRNNRCSSIGPGVVSPPPPSHGAPSLPINTPSVPIDALRAVAIVEQMAQHVDGRRLAVRAGDADELQLARRPSVRRRAGDRRRATAVVHDERRQRRARRILDDRQRRRRPSRPRRDSRARRAPCRERRRTAIRA